MALAALLTRGTDDASAVPPSVEDVSRRVLLRFALLETGVALRAAALLRGRSAGRCTPPSCP